MSKEVVVGEIKRVANEQNRAPKCCWPECFKDGFAAEWEIRFGSTSDDYTHACSAHVGELLQEGINTVYPVP